MCFVVFFLLKMMLSFYCLLVNLSISFVFRLFYLMLNSWVRCIDKHHTTFFISHVLYVLVSHAKAFIVVVIEVLDALMNHLEETLEVVLSRGENLALDNKGVK